MSLNFEIETADGPMGAYLVRPKVYDAPVVITLHEVFGVNADLRQTCNELADAGYIAMCPDLFWRREPAVDLDVRSAEDWNKGLSLYMQFDRDRGVQDILCALDLARNFDGASGRVGVLGYCLGGLLAFLTAVRGSPDAAVAFHGADTDRYLDEAVHLHSPLQMHLAMNDEFIPENIRLRIVEALETRDGVEIFSYPGVQHAFSRHGGLHHDAQAARLANERTAAFLKRTLMN